MASEKDHAGQISVDIHVTWIAKFQAIPFVNGGRDFRGCDCWGLHRLICAERLGIELPLWDTVTADDRRAVVAAVEEQTEADCWRAVARSQAIECDLVLIRQAGEAVHVGTHIGHERLIHTQRQIGAVVIGLGHPRISRRIEGIYRYVG